MTARKLASSKILGGFVLVPIPQILGAWQACQRKPLTCPDFRTWLACREMVAKRCGAGETQNLSYSLVELIRLNGVSLKRARASVQRLVVAGLLTCSAEAITFPDLEPSDPMLLKNTISGGKGSLAIPRRMLRLLAGGARPALIATALGILLRCLSRTKAGFHSGGRVKSSWIATTFGVDRRRVKQARKELVKLGWITTEPSDQWLLNKYGPVYKVNLLWDRTAPDAGTTLPPPPAQNGPTLPPPDSDLDPLRGKDKNQEPVPGKLPGVETKDPGAKRPEPPRPKVGAGEASPPRLRDVQPEDLEDTGRLLQLHAEAIERGWVSTSESDRLKFLAAAEHAKAVGTKNPCGLFARLVRQGWYHLTTQDDEDAASVRLRRHLFGGFLGLPKLATGLGMAPMEKPKPLLSDDALLVRDVRSALKLAGYTNDPFYALRTRDAAWTRDRWNRAVGELSSIARFG